FAVNKEAYTPDDVAWRARNSIEMRHSLLGEYWGVGASTKILVPRTGSTPDFSGRTDMRDPQITIIAQYLDLSPLPFYGLGNDTNVQNVAKFELHQGSVSASLLYPLPYHFALTLVVGWIGARAQNPPGDPAHSISSVFS